MVIIISYNKQTWNEYNDSQSADENLANGAIISADRLNNMETGISNNDTNKVTDNHDNTITANSSIYDLSKSGLTPLQYVDSGSFNDLPLGTVMAYAPTMTDSPDTTHAFTTTTFYASQWSGRKAQIAIADNTNLMYFRVGINIDVGASWGSWTLLSDDSVIQLNSTDMNTVRTAGFYRLNSGTNGMPNADAWTIYQVIPLFSKNGVQIAYETNNVILGMRSWNYGNNGNALNFTSWIQFANDSTVAHLSGANNFDTVPTYGTNNKPFAINDTGATTARPTGQAVGYQYFDTTLNKPIWYNGANWVDSTGTTV